jgi:hypothetical protein
MWVKFVPSSLMLSNITSRSWGLRRRRKRSREETEAKAEQEEEDEDDEEEKEERPSCEGHPVEPQHRARLWPPL